MTQDSYTPEEMEEIFARRLVEQNRREREDLISAGFADLTQRVEKANHLKREIVQRVDTQLIPRMAAVESSFARMQDVIDALAATSLTIEEKANFILMMKKFTFDGEVHRLWNSRVAKACAIVVAVMAVVSPFLVLWIGKMK